MLNYYGDFPSGAYDTWKLDYPDWYDCDYVEPKYCVFCDEPLDPDSEQEDCEFCYDTDNTDPN